MTMSSSYPSARHSTSTATSSRRTSGRYSIPNTNYLTALSVALFTTGTFVYVPEGVDVEDVTVRAEMNSRSLFSQTLVVAEESSSVTIRVDRER